ncbi:hypothetical protein B7494_g808 [Chlorociboria aeruginascens]|nr:hypothetical protein B7494_g808 [Chlorociboria aeruginascens]
MNWTGGRLQRHSKNAQTTLTTQQKLHFAKVQASLRSGANKASPLKRSKLSRQELGSHAEKGLSSHVSEIRRTPGDKGTYPKISQTPSSPNSKSVPHRHRGDTGYPLAFLDSKPTQNHPHISPPYIPPIKREHDDDLDDDLYSATPLPWQAKQVLPASAHTPEGYNSQDDKRGSMAEKRRRLLRKGDWTGVNLQQPIGLKYIAPRQDENIGRRRKVPGNHNSRHSPKLQSRIYNFMEKQIPIHEHYRTHEAQSSNDVRISISSREMSPSASPSSAPSKIRGRLAQSRLVKFSQTESSDVMLLDVEQDVASRSTVTHRDVPSTVEIQELCHRSHRHHERSRADRSQSASKRPRDTRRRMSVNPEHYDTAHGSNTRIQQSRSRSRSYQSGNKMSCHSLPDQECIVPRSNDGRLIFSSSTASIEHPMPRSSKLSILIHSEEDEDTGSVIAQVGLPKSVVPFSHVLDNEIWNTWMAAVGDRDESQDERISISPGISTAIAFRNDVRDSSGYDNGSFLDIEPPDPKEIPDQSFSSKDPASFTPPDSPIIEHGNNTRDSSADAALRPFLADTDDSALEIREELMYQEHAIREIKGEEGPDEIWRKFVLGNSDNLEEVVPDEQSKISPRSVERPNTASSSMQAQPSIQNLTSTSSKEFISPHDSAASQRSPRSTASSLQNEATQLYGVRKRKPSSRSQNRS